MDEKWHPLFCEALNNIEQTEYLLDTLLNGDVRDRAFLCKIREERQRVFMNELENLTTAERNALQEALQENRKPMSVNEVKEMMLRTEKGAMKNTIGNCLIVLQNDPYLAYIR